MIDFLVTAFCWHVGHLHMCQCNTLAAGTCSLVHSELSWWGLTSSLHLRVTHTVCVMAVTTAADLPNISAVTTAMNNINTLAATQP
jgi:hypothetical protein